MTQTWWILLGSLWLATAAWWGLSRYAHVRRGLVGADGRGRAN
ncbi:hypothetical protein [Streptomonospora nanhaiensis]|uniref:Uncharacterized protein n=1 Tax=Streptomonospora nanhaiensis TaxID=1323731 RepID=A0A853BV11_9ACTN|nr:hypothetical protein [Streptomonospora nanhaiensis]NYI99128.1 hypothetical protein [Streptomonospora nanhaiensis]